MQVTLRAESKRRAPSLLPMPVLTRLRAWYLLCQTTVSRLRVLSNTALWYTLPGVLGSRCLLGRSQVSRFLLGCRLRRSRRSRLQTKYLPLCTLKFPTQPIPLKSPSRCKPSQAPASPSSGPSRAPSFSTPSPCRTFKLRCSLRASRPGTVPQARVRSTGRPDVKPPPPAQPPPKPAQVQSHLARSASSVSGRFRQVGKFSAFGM
mmetsp:Transcript_42733/g.100434  ORF Transcript_42733/g.100434 Transcript_42733/m.100434 type:complete len:205 (-) Transcript_42733:44-658(-)